jgi:hypothetical protein
MIRERTIKFEGTETSESEFHENFSKVFEDFVRIDEGPSGRIMYRLAWEIVRNIFDHAYGWGYMRLTEISKGTIEFEIGNSEIPDSERASLVKRRTSPSSGVGLGRNGKPGMIQERAEYLGIALTIDIPGGYIYRGVYKKEKVFPRCS